MKIKTQADFKSLEIVHIFEYYDVPLVFISKSPSDEYYLNYYIDEVQEGVDKWLFSRISNKERLDLLEQRLSMLTLLKRLFVKGRLYHLCINPFLNDLAATLESELVNQGNFDPESFPEEDFYVEYDYVTSQNLIKVEEEVIDSSKFKMVLKDEANSHDISFDLLLDIFGNFKRTLGEIANDIGKKMMGESAMSPINLKVDSLQPSSFGVWIKMEPNDIFDVPEQSLNNLFEIIEDISTKDQKEIEEQIEIDETYSLETIKNIRNMLKNISENEYSFKLQGTKKSDGTIKEVTFDKNSYDKLDVLVNILHENSERSSELIEIEGELTSVNTTYNKFRISTTTIGDIGGKMSTQLFRTLKDGTDIQFRVPSAIKAKVEKEIINDLVEETTSEKFTLISFEQPN